MKILYEDNHLIVVEKPVNVPVQADASGDMDLLSMVRTYIKETYHKPGEAYCALVHRLDRPVGGVMVFAKTSKAAARLTAQFKGREAKKRYAAVVVGNPPSACALTDYLLKDEATHSSRVVTKDTPGAKEARLRYALLAKTEHDALIDVELMTGRPHQIRVQMMHSGYPLVNDQRYNRLAVPGGQIALWSYSLTLKHPTLNEEMRFFSAPQGEAFKAYETAIKYLPAHAVCRGVYENENYLVVDKNVGAEVEGELISELLSIEPNLRAVHRLDANTAGLVVLARNEASERQLLDAFYTHEIVKTYHAIVLGTPEKSGHLVHYGLKDAEKGQMHIVSPSTPNALRMALSYRVLESRNGLSKLEITLETGRTHQIRAQFAAIGHPLLGDDRYGNRQENRARRVKTQQLIAKRLSYQGQTFTSLRELTL